MEVNLGAIRQGYLLKAADLLHDDEIAWVAGKERCVCAHLSVFHTEEYGCLLPDCNCTEYRTPAMAQHIAEWEAKAIVAATRSREEDAEWNAVWVEPTAADKERGPTYRYVRQGQSGGNADE